jgi:hypothetical protein
LTKLDLPESETEHPGPDRPQTSAAEEPVNGHRTSLPAGGIPAEVILISARAETDYEDLVAESPAAGFLVKSELSAQAISRILQRSSLRGLDWPGPAGRR